MIPPADATLDPVTSARWQFTRLAAHLRLVGLPAEQILADAREGIGLGAVASLRAPATVAAVMGEVPRG